MNGEICVYLYPLYHLSFYVIHYTFNGEERWFLFGSLTLKIYPLLHMVSESINILEGTGWEKSDMEECSTYQDCKQSSEKKRV